MELGCEILGFLLWLEIELSAIILLVSFSRSCYSVIHFRQYCVNQNTVVIIFLCEAAI